MKHRSVFLNKFYRLFMSLYSLIVSVFFLKKKKTVITY